MMKTKYYRYTLEGEHSAEEAVRMLGDAASQGMIVRIDNIGGQTQVYIASQIPTGAKSTLPAGKREKGAGKLKVKEVSKSEVTKPL
jgi:hypothetical protein